MEIVNVEQRNQEIPKIRGNSKLFTKSIGEGEDKTLVVIKLEFTPTEQGTDLFYVADGKNQIMFDTYPLIKDESIEKEAGEA